MYLILNMGTDVYRRGAFADNVNLESVPVIESLSLIVTIEI